MLYYLFTILCLSIKDFLIISINIILLMKIILGIDVRQNSMGYCIVKESILSGHFVSVVL